MCGLPVIISCLSASLRRVFSLGPIEVYLHSRESTEANQHLTMAKVRQIIPTTAAPNFILLSLDTELYNVCVYSGCLHKKTTVQIAASKVSVDEVDTPGQYNILIFINNGSVSRRSADELVRCGTCSIQCVVHEVNE
jgi:hypothetical protein